ncbi:MAG: hypothetical protein ACXW1F_08260 [Halobacteriota archaeon]
MSDEEIPRIVEYLPPERYALGKDAATRIPDPFGNETFIDRLFSRWRLNQDRETWKAHAAALDAMRSAVIANRMTIEAVIEYLETAERFAEIKRIREEGRA